MASDAGRPQEADSAAPESDEELRIDEVAESIEVDVAVSEEPSLPVDPKDPKGRGAGPWDTSREPEGRGAGPWDTSREPEGRGAGPWDTERDDDRR